MNSHTKTTSMTPHFLDSQHLNEILAQQKHAYLRYPLPTAKERIDRLARLKRILVKYQDQFADAINQDYGNRSVGETKIGELLTCLEHIKYYSKNLTTVSTSRRDRHHRTVELPFIIIHWSSDLCVSCGQPCHDQNFQFIGCFWQGTGKSLS